VNDMNAIILSITLSAVLVIRVRKLHFINVAVGPL
jgi:hypothetical protein